MAVQKTSNRKPKRRRAGAGDRAEHAPPVWGGMFDIETGEYRESTTKDLYDAAHIVDAMENIHHFSRSVVAHDIEDNLVMVINTVYAVRAI